MQYAQSMIVLTMKVSMLYLIGQKKQQTYVLKTWYQPWLEVKQTMQRSRKCRCNRQRFMLRVQALLYTRRLQEMVLALMNYFSIQERGYTQESYQIIQLIRLAYLILEIQHLSNLLEVCLARSQGWIRLISETRLIMEYQIQLLKEVVVQENRVTKDDVHADNSTY